jgi:GNAT superfamily N-acetyltransferase
VSIPSWSAPGVTLEVRDGHQAAEREAELIALHDEAAGVDNPGFPRRLGVWRRQPGFALAEASHGGYLVGYACGLPLRPSTDWWRGLTTPLPAAITDERPGRTFALTQLLVRSSWRRQGIGAELCELVMDGRAEERATVKLPAGAAAAQAAFRNWGWTKVGRVRDPAGSVGSVGSVSDVLTRLL